MLRGVYASASGMLAGASSQRIISNNVANMNTPGHRSEYPTLSPFGALFLQRTDAGGRPGVSPSDIPMPGRGYPIFIFRVPRAAFTLGVDRLISPWTEPATSSSRVIRGRF